MKKVHSVRRYIVRAEGFADLFNAKVPGAYRQVTADDIRLLTQCGLVGRYSFYDTVDDLQTVIGILNYERLTQQRTRKEVQEASPDPPRCKSCGQALPTEPEGKKGRPREYCTDCESSRPTMRGRKWRRKMKAAIN